MLQGKKILLAISGSIAAYKTPHLVRLLVKAGAEVKVVMTSAATGFVTPLVLGTVSRNPVLHDLFENETWSNHVMLGRWADVMLVAPASCNTMAKMAHGICDNLLQAVYLSATCPVMLAPAMDEDMYHHPSTQCNMDLLRSYGHHFLPVEHGELASGLIGQGRMSEPESIVQYLNSYFATGQRYAGKNVLITAGPTYEMIDPVRFIGNFSSGKMGIAIAESFARQGAEVKLVLGPVEARVQEPGIEVIKVRGAQQMFDACVQHFPQADIAVMSAAVADYTPESVSDTKIKKKEDHFSIPLRKTNDILRHLGSIKTDAQLLVGFALETNNEEANALQKLRDKNADVIVLNSLNDAGAGFGHDTNKVTLLFKDGSRQDWPLLPKTEVAAKLTEALLDRL
jgi:phosphopantothenoylcysteine decarboxylase/phosphopantothenate--cysteine ligase